MSTIGSWDQLQSWPLIGIHAVVTQDGKLLTFGTNPSGQQGAMIHDLWDPVTGVHETIDHHTHTPTDIFCSAAIIIPGTDKILIAGGDARPLGHTNLGVSDVNLFDAVTHDVSPDSHGSMAFARWYATAIALTDGRILVMGGLDDHGQGVTAPEVYTPGVGWKTLTGAADPDMLTANTYPRAFVNEDGKVVYFTTAHRGDFKTDLVLLDPAGDGSITRIGSVPFDYSADSQAVMYAPGKLLVTDAGTGLWKIDINGDAPVAERIATLSQERNYGNMTVLADGTVMINGGTGSANLQAFADKTPLLWDPRTGELTELPDEANPRLYHSTSVLLPDGSLLSLGGGAPGEQSYLDGQVYRPAYLFDADGNPVDRPVIVDAPKHPRSGSTFTITVGDAASIERLTLVKNGAVTHTFNMEARAAELVFTVGPDNRLEVTLPGVEGGIVAGTWMLFAWDASGAPSIAAMVNVDPVFGTGGTADASNLLRNGSFETAADINGSLELNFVLGWTSSQQSFDLWSDGHLGYRATDGRTLIEIDAELGTLAQEVGTARGELYGLSFDLVGQPGAGLGSDLEVLWNGEIIATVSADDGLAQRVELELIGTGGGDVLAFRTAGGEAGTSGGLIDQVVLEVLGYGDGRPDALGRIIGDEQANTIRGSNYADVILAYGGDDVIVGRGGSDRILAGQGNDELDGGDGNDSLRGNGGSDTLEGGAGNDTLEGGRGDDLLIASSGSDRYFGGWELDTLDLSRLNARVDLDLSRGRFTSSAGDGKLQSIEQVIGSSRNDILWGSRRDDVIHGGDGADRIRANRGDDVLSGGAGADTFEYYTTDVVNRSGGRTFGTDTILDFDAGDGDRLDFRQLVRSADQLTIEDTSAGLVISAEIGTANVDVVLLGGVHRLTLQDLIDDHAILL